MCGIAGLVQTQKIAVEPKQIRKMLEALSHRGPNDWGIMLYDSQSMQFEIETQLTQKNHEEHTGQKHPNFQPDIAFGNRRLSIVDPSFKGHQPFPNEKNTVWVVFNGEIYNYKELKEKLDKEGHIFISNCDTEVIVHGYESWGFDGLLKRIKGMWAIAIWDSAQKRTFLARDPYGVKPLYYHYENGTFCFSSEKKSIRTYKPDLKLNEKRIADLFWFDELLPPETFWHGINELAPANCIELDIVSSQLIIRKYYEIEQVQEQWKELQGKNAGFQRALNEIKESLTDSVKKHTDSDQPIAFFLSGGIDSSILGSISANNYELKQSVECFTAIPEDNRFSEEIYVKSMKEKYPQINIHFSRPKFEDFIRELPEFVKIFDSPLLSTSSYMEFKVLSEIKARGFKIAIYGQGADEIFGGYRSYLINFIKNLFKEKKFVDCVKEAIFFRNVIIEYLGKYMRRKLGIKEKGFKRIIKMQKPIPKLNLTDMTLNQRLIHDLMQGGYLNDIVKTNDIVSMHYAIENRVPFLYQPFVEKAVGLPYTLKIHTGWTKFTLREAFKEELPNIIRKRKDKLGFPGPDKLWAIKMIQQEYPHMIEIVEELSDYIDVKGFEELCSSIMKKAKGEELQLFWRIVLFGYWHKYAYIIEPKSVEGIKNSNKFESKNNLFEQRFNGIPLAR